MSSEAVNLNGYQEIKKLLSDKNAKMSDEEILSVFSDSMNSESIGGGDFQI